MGRPLHRIGVCSWSLSPRDVRDLADKARACGVEGVQLALDPIRKGAWPEGETARVLRAEGITVMSGMMAMAGEDYSTLESIRRTGGVRPDEHWEENLASAAANAALAARLGLALVTFHAGFLPHGRTVEEDGLRRVMLERVGRIADVFSAAGVSVA